MSEVVLQKPSRTWQSGPARIDFPVVLVGYLRPEEPLQTFGVLTSSPDLSSPTPTIPAPSASDWEIFGRLVDKWRTERGSTSSTSKMINCESYRAIIGFGEKAIPMLLWELEKRPDFWFAALRAITKEDPVPNDARGNVRRMTDAWLNWGRQRGYLEVAGHQLNGHF